MRNMDKKKLLTAGGAAAVLVALLTGVYLLFFSKGGIVIAIGGPSTAATASVASASTPSPTANATTVRFPQPGEGIMYNTGARIVNLLDPVGRLYLKIGIVIEFLPPDYTFYQLEPEKQAEVRDKFLAGLGQVEPLIHDLITNLLTGKTYEDVYTPEGKNLLRAELIDGLNAVLSHHQVMNVYFTEFIIQ